MKGNNPPKRSKKKPKGYGVERREQNRKFRGEVIRAMLTRPADAAAPPAR